MEIVQNEVVGLGLGIGIYVSNILLKKDSFTTREQR